MRTRIADDYDSIRENMGKLSGAAPKPSIGEKIRQITAKPFGDILWWQVGADFYLRPETAIGRGALAPYVSVDGNVWIFGGHIPPELLALGRSGLCFQPIPAP